MVVVFLQKRGEVFFYPKGGKYLPHKQDFMTLPTLAYFYNTKKSVLNFYLSQTSYDIAGMANLDKHDFFNVYKHSHSETFKIAYLDKHLLWTPLLCSAQNISIKF